MTKFNYQTICSNLLKDLPQRYKDIIIRRFGLRGERETLESIGKTYHITRERVRQIEEDGLKRLKEKANAPVCQNVFQYFISQFKKWGSLGREDLLLFQLGGQKLQNHIFFLLTLGKPFERFAETGDFYSFWAIDKDSFNMAKKAVNSFIGELKNKKRPLSLPSNVKLSYIEISKNILRGPEGLYGFKNWAEINPRGIKDRAYLVFKKENAPLHFAKVASLINSSSFASARSVNAQTAHNELIKDRRFVLMGRGLYALGEWGYEPGIVREVIEKTIKQAGRPLAREEIVKKVLGQRQVKPNTILLNLQNKEYFVKNSEGKYKMKKA